MTKDEELAMDLALETLESIQAAYPCETVGKRITAIKQARSAPVQEPAAITEQMAFAFHNAITDGAIGTDDLMEIMRGLEAAFAHITTPPATKRPFVGLTDEDWKELHLTTNARTYGPAIEAKLKEKNT